MRSNPGMKLTIRPLAGDADLAVFRVLNEGWIQHPFALEAEDRRELDDPVRAYVEPGGEILIAEVPGGGGRRRDDRPGRQRRVGTVEDGCRARAAEARRWAAARTNAKGPLRAGLSGRPAEGVGFEPTVQGLPAQRFSRPPDSTALAPLQGEREG